MSRVFHTDSRSFANFQPAELAKLCGLGPSRWAEYALKELVDNALAVVEDSANPVVKIVVDGTRLAVYDSGPGISDDILAAILDFEKFGGSNRHHKLPTRGAQGNALMTIFGIASVWGTYVTIGRRTGSVKLTVVLDQVRQSVSVEREDAPPTAMPCVEIGLNQASFKRGGVTLQDLVVMSRRLAALNPHSTVMLDLCGDKSIVPATIGAAPAMPGNATAGAAEWFTASDFAERLSADVRARPALPIGNWRSEFYGVSVKFPPGLPISEMAPSDPSALRTLSTNVRNMTVAASNPTIAFNPVGKNALLSMIIGGDDITAQYTAASGTFTRDEATIPFLLEVALVQMPAKRKEAPQPLLCMNRTLLYGSPNFKAPPLMIREKVRGKHFTSTGDLSAAINAYGLLHGDYCCGVVVHVTCPSPGYEGYGKQQFDTSWLAGPLSEALETVTLEVRKQRSGEGRRKSERKNVDSIQDKLFAMMPAVLAEATDNGKLPVLLRQLFYTFRKAWFTTDDRPLHYATFCAYVSMYEVAVGKAICLKDPRGSLYEPHSGRVVQLGTALMDNFQPKRWEGHTIIFIEKENLANLLVRLGVGKRWDAIIIGSKGFAVEACCEALQKYAKLLPGLVKIVALHDADPAGYMIGYDLATNLPRFGDNVQIDVIDIGLTIEEARAMSLQDEPFDLSRQVWSMVRGMKSKTRPDGTPLLDAAAWDSFMPPAMRYSEFPGNGTGRRVELNAIHPRQFAAWVEEKLEQHGCRKVRPPDDIVNSRLTELRHNAVSNRVSNALMNRLGAEIVVEVMRELGMPQHDLDAVLAGRPEQNWDYFLHRTANMDSGAVDAAVTRAMSNRGFQ